MYLYRFVNFPDMVTAFVKIIKIALLNILPNPNV